MDDALLEARHIQVRYGEVEAVRDASLRVARGESLALVGESGSGKSTLLKCFNGMVEVRSGEVLVEGAALSRGSVVELRRRLGYVQQEGGLLPHWSVRRNIELVPRLRGWTTSRIQARLERLLPELAVDFALLDRRPGALSGGQRQRVAVARALAADPDILLLDEPFGALDPITRSEIQDEAVQWKRHLGKTMLMVTHDLREAFKLADRIAVMRAGRILQCARPERLLADPAGDYVARLVAAVE
jgi:osmoprotectant transport system ATP-binding protein